MNKVAVQSLQDEKFEDQQGFTRFLRKEPLGPILIIAAWNYPYLTMGRLGRVASVIVCLPLF
jgi:acyl-CoA reductase-like NAD-dependent aldehyde dehydrogenase